MNTPNRSSNMRNCLLIVACCLSLPAIAEPSRTVQYLMAEPVTLFDQGLKRLGEKLVGVLLKEEFPEVLGNLDIGSKPETSADYDWKSRS